LAVSLLAFGIALFGRRPSVETVPPLFAPSVDPHLRAKGRVRAGIVFGMVTLQCVLMPIYGAQDGFIIAFGLAAVVFAIVHKLFDL
jgi:hypothetical protein